MGRMNGGEVMGASFAVDFCCVDLKMVERFL